MKSFLKMLLKKLTPAAGMAALLVICGPVFAQQVCEPQNLASKYPTLVGKVVKIGADPENPPYVMRDKVHFDKIVGVDAELAQAVLDCVGVKHEFFLGSWSGLLPAVMSGQIEVMWDDLAYRPDRAKSVDYIIYMTAGNAALVPAGNPKHIASIGDICGLSVAYAVGSVEEGFVRKQADECKGAGKPPVASMPFQDLAAGLRLLDSGRADAVMWDLAFIDSMVKDNPKKYARAFAFNTGVPVGAAVPKNSEELRKAIYEGLKIIQANGVQNDIFKKYGVDPGISTSAEIKTQ
ncbi:amino acid ABC transporter substrate-binding protein, PAAT family [Burkholderia sp. GAS332]|nr:amino acid ABC transporter substrate-binding protein, PAAT family [Burkholderia sp. GAS332]